MDTNVISKEEAIEPLIEAGLSDKAAAAMVELALIIQRIGGNHDIEN